jgi:hypothetical protein
LQLVLFGKSLPFFKHTIVMYRGIHIFKNDTKGRNALQQRRTGRNAATKKRNLDHKKKEMPPSNNLRQLAFLRGSTAIKKIVLANTIDGWEHLTKLTAI